MTPRPDETDLVSELLIDLGVAFDLHYRVGDEELGDRLERHLREIARDDSPSWGTDGDPREIASAESPNLRFVYRPHLFPGMEPKLRLAHELQFALLPTRLPSASPVAVSAVLESYCHLSGDLLGWQEKAPGHMRLWVIDVSGHGVRSGLASAVLEQFLREAPIELGPAALLHWLHDAFRAARSPSDPLSLYATGVVLEIRDDGELVYASAGHQPMFRVRGPGELETLPSTGPPIAILEQLPIVERRLEIAPDEIVVIYTDGIIETESPDGEPFGHERFEALVRSAPATLRELTASVHHAVIRHNRERMLDDDLTLVVARRRS